MVHACPNINAAARFTASEAAAILGVSRRTIYVWEENGRIVRAWNKHGGYFTGAAIVKAWRGM